MTILSRLLLTLALSLSSVLAQIPSSPPTAAPQPVFDVVSIHEHKPGDDGMSIRFTQTGGFIGTNVSLTNLLMNAYGIRPDLISRLPGWADSTGFDVNAKISDADPDALKNLSREQRRAMMLALLNDRFHLRAHIETRTLPVYDLVIAKGGSKLKENTTLPDLSSANPNLDAHNLKPGMVMTSPTQMIAVAIPISNLAANLAFQVERTVIDKTGLTAKYNINLKWTPPEAEGKQDGLTDNAAPELFTALQEQLGLKLEPSKGPVDTLVIDHVEMPTEN